MLKAFPSFKKRKFNSDIFCNVCNTNLSIAYKGRKCIEDYQKTENYISHWKSQAGTSKPDTFTRTTSNDKIIKSAEATLAFHTVKHHKSFHSVGCTTKIHNKMYQDSLIVKSLKYGHTKLKVIVNGGICNDNHQKSDKRFIICWNFN